MAVTLIPKKRSFMEHLLGDGGTFLEYRGIIVKAGGVVLAVVIITAGLWFYRSHIRASLENVRIAITALQEQYQVVQSQSEEMRLFASNAKALQALLQNRKSAAPLFQFLEYRTYKKVVLTSVDFNINTLTLSLLGETDGYISLAEQIVLWKNDPDVKKAEATTFSLGNDGILSFGASLVLNPGLFTEEQ